MTPYPSHLLSVYKIVLTKVTRNTDISTIVDEKKEGVGGGAVTVQTNHTTFHLFS